MTHHPIFSAFPAVSEAAPRGFQMDFLGTKFRCEFDGCSEGASWEPPVVGEEYFEWIALLEAVAGAKDRFVMVELGAGYGRWCVRGASAARRGRKIPFHLVAVEPDPLHFQWLQTAMVDNQVDQSSATLIQAAVAAKKGEAWFQVETPEGQKGSSWYGQRLADRDQNAVGAAGMYCGHDLIFHENGYRSMKVRKMTLKEILDDIPVVDLVDMDIQGEELEVIDGSVRMLNRKVKRLHIGTHSSQIDENLRRILRRADWYSTADYAFGQSCVTPWGPVTFGDGAQTWVNPRLTDL